jgi:hypothetical protein
MAKSMMEDGPQRTMQKFLTEKEVALPISLSLVFLRRWRLEQRGPRFVKVGVLVRYRPEDLEQWTENLPTGTAARRPEIHVRLESV